MDWKFCWIVSIIFVILFKIYLLELKFKQDQEESVKETKEDAHKIPEEIRNMNFDERMDYWINEQGDKYEEFNKLYEELYELETQINKQKQDMFNGKWML